MTYTEQDRCRKNHEERNFCSAVQGEIVRRNGNNKMGYAEHHLDNSVTNCCYDTDDHRDQQDQAEDDFDPFPRGKALFDFGFGRVSIEACGSIYDKLTLRAKGFRFLEGKKYVLRMGYYPEITHSVPLSIRLRR